VVVASTAATCVISPVAASAAPISTVFAGQTVSGQGIPCTPQADGVRVCHGADGGASGPDLRLKSFDDTPLEVYVILPPAPSSGTDGSYPLIAQSHGWGSSAGGPGNKEFAGPTADTWAQQGYAVLQLTARGFNDSCGSAASRVADSAGCQNGYIRLDDARYEARDVQNATGLLVDAGIVDPARIGVTGESYGGGVSLALGTLKDRIMNVDGTLSPWKSPAGTPLSVAASAPVIPWSDLAYSLVPNGHPLDYQVASPTTDLSPIGVEKQSFNSGLYALGQTTGYYAPAGANTATGGNDDLTTWYSVINAGEPYEGNSAVAPIVQQIAQFHSPYYLLDGAYGTAKEAPSPLLIANGFTDDLFPVDEALRYYNLERSLYPSDPISLFDGDFGHMRAQNKAGDAALLSSTIQAFFDHYLKGAGAQPGLGATSMIETCPSTAASGGPFTAASWAALHPGEVDYSSSPAQTISSSAGDPTVARAIDPIAGDGACATVPGSDQGSGVATYRLPAATGSGYTLLGSPTVIAKLSVSGLYPFIAARLWDVNTAANTQTLVARGIYRIDPNATDGLQVFQLHPGAWHFASGHVPKLELLGQDSPYARTSNGQFSITVSGLQLRLPVHEQPGSAAVVIHPLPPVKPHPHGAPACVARPTSTIAKRRVHASRRLLVASGTAGERPCAHAIAATQRRQRVQRVYVMIYRPAAHGRCRFLQRSGKFTVPRSCTRPVEFLAKGTSRWTLRLRVPIPRGSGYLRADAIDGFGHHQLRSSASVARFSVN
jgi:hypothetical protein